VKVFPADGQFVLGSILDTDVARVMRAISESPRITVVRSSGNHADGHITCSA